jgi:hypothetical protein
LDEVVVVPPLLIAAGEELAERAVVDRVRVGVAAVRDRGEEPIAKPPVVGVEVIGPIGLPHAKPGHDVHRRRAPPGDPLDLLRVEAELNQVPGPRVPRELGVQRLVAPVRLPLEKVREPAPAAVREDGLVDDVRLLRNGSSRCTRSAIEVAILAQANLDHRLTTIA